jgi:transcriptional regulator with XRE-family HTH domain
MARYDALADGVLARRVRASREEEGWTLHDLAARSGVAVSTIQKIETGQMVPTLSVLSKIANGLRRPSPKRRTSTSRGRLRNSMFDRREAFKIVLTP